MNPGDPTLDPPPPDGAAGQLPAVSAEVSSEERFLSRIAQLEQDRQRQELEIANLQCSVLGL